LGLSHGAFHGRTRTVSLRKRGEGAAGKVVTKVIVPAMNHASIGGSHRAQKKETNEQTYNRAGPRKGKEVIQS